MAGLIRRVNIYRTAIPMRTFEHAASSRALAEAIIVRAEFNDGHVGWGEALPRPYVTGESLDSVVDDIREIIWPACKGVRFEAFSDADNVPTAADDGRRITSAAWSVVVP